MGNLQLPMPLALAILLLVSSPGTLSFAVVRHTGWWAEGRKRLVHSVVATGLAALCVVCFGWPSFGVSGLSVAAGIVGGFVYYFVEQLRVSRTSRAVLRAAYLARDVSASNLIGIGVVGMMGAAEELIFRWYLFTVPVRYGLLPAVGAATVAIVLFAVLHYEYGISTMISRGVFGLLLTLAVGWAGVLCSAVLVHAVYNSLVQARPVRYLRERKASLI